MTATPTSANAQQSTHKNWADVLDPVLTSPKSQAMFNWLDAQENAGKQIFPPRGSRTRAFDLTPLDAVRVVILGQDPYHGEGQAHGLAFSVQQGVRTPPSLKNIYKELESDCGITPPDHGNLEHWAKQGVLLLNNALTVEEGKAGSHQKRGWEEVTDAAVAGVAAKPEPCVFLLWGDHAIKKALRVPGLEESHHLVLKAPHPSPLSAYRGFFGCRHFSQTNAFLEKHGRGSIAW